MDDVDLVPGGWVRHSEFLPKQMSRDIVSEQNQLIADFEAEYGLTLTRQRHLGIITYYFGASVLPYLDAESLLARLKYLALEEGQTELIKGFGDVLVEADRDATATADDVDIDIHRSRFR